MYWTIIYRNGVVLTEAADRAAAHKWCETQLGRPFGPFAIIQAIEADLEEFGMPMHIGGREQDITGNFSELKTRDIQAQSGLEDQSTLH